MMAWPTKESVWEFNIGDTRREVASIASVISRHEPVSLFTINDTDNLDTARSMLGANIRVSIHPVTKLDSLWARDTGPIFVRSFPNESTVSTVSGVVMHFNNWGSKFDPTADFGTARCVLDQLKVPSVSACFVGEGGGLEVDGEGTLLATESSLLNGNRNPGKSKEELEEEFFRLFGITKTLWLKGIKGHDITDAHVDAVARFVEPGLVVLSRPSAKSPESDKEVYEDAKMRLSTAIDAHGRPIRVVELPEPEYEQFENNPVVSYVNYYVANGAVISPRFGDNKADVEAARILSSLYPERVVEQVFLRQLPMQGGGIHCATQQILV